MGITNLLVGWVCGAGVLWIADRRSGTTMMLATLAAMLAMLLARGAESLVDPWEPLITLLVLALFAMTLWELAVGTVRVLPLTIGLGAFLATTWLILAPIVAVCGVFVAAVLVRDVALVRRGSFDEASRRLYWSLGLAMLVAVVMLTPSLVEQFGSTPGNITEMLRLAPPVAGERAGIAEAWNALSIQFTAHPSWLGTIPLGFDSKVLTGQFRWPVMFGVWIVAAAWTSFTMVKRRDERESRSLLSEVAWLHVVVAFLTSGLLVSMALTWGGIFPWTVEPSRALGMMMALAVFLSILSALPRRVLTVVRGLADVVLGLVSVVLTVALSIGATGVGARGGVLRPALAELADGASDQIARTGSPRDVVLVRSDASVSAVFGADEFGIAELGASLERAGIDVVVDPDLENRFGAERAQTERADGELLLLSESGPPSGEGWKLLDRVDPLTARQREKRADTESKITQMADGAPMTELLARSKDDPELYELLMESFTNVDQPVLYLWYRQIGKA
jgi:hypothetical protein